MEFLKIQLTKQNTLNATYKNDDGDVIQFQGANIVHKDLKEAMNALIPHLAIITEQREAYGRTLEAVRSDRITDEGTDNVFKRFTADTISLSSNETEVTVSGVRILMKTGIVQLATPKINLESDEDYDYHDELSLDIDAVRFEVRQYIEERKWGVKEATIEFKDIDPFKGVEADAAPEAEPAPKKRGRKPKNAA